MTEAWLEILAAGAQCALQDAGRFAFRRHGVPWSGALDRQLLNIANTLVGNAADACAIECVDGGQHFIASEGDVRIAVAGDAELDVLGSGGARHQPPWCSFRLAHGESLRLRRLRHGRIAMLAVEGLALHPQLGSCATYARASLGGLDGHALRAGQRIGPLPRHRGDGERHLPQPPLLDVDPIRVVLGPQDDYFSAASIGHLLTQPFRISTAADRMGIRLEGPMLKPAEAREMVSDATVPGSIQVPGDGQPIVLLADAQTAGGYPKIATVISCDLGRLAQRQPGSLLRFTAIDVARAEALARQFAAETRAFIAACRPLYEGGVDLQALYAENLVDGIIRAE